MTVTDMNCFQGGEGKEGKFGDDGDAGACGCEVRTEGKCNCDTHIFVVHSQTDEVRGCSIMLPILLSTFESAVSN